MTLNHFDQRPVPATDSTPDSAPPSPPGIASIADALREAARLAAVRDLLAEREQELRAWLEAVAERIDRWLNASTGDAEDRAARLRELLDDPKAVKESVLLSEGLLDDLAATCDVTEDGTVVDVETGETVPVRAVPNSSPALVIRVDLPARRRFAAELRRRLPMLGQPAVRPAPSAAALEGQPGEGRRAG